MLRQQWMLLPGSSSLESMIVVGYVDSARVRKLWAADMSWRHSTSMSSYLDLRCLARCFVFCCEPPRKLREFKVAKRTLVFLFMMIFPLFGISSKFHEEYFLCFSEFMSGCRSGWWRIGQKRGLSPFNLKTACQKKIHNCVSSVEVISMYTDSVLSDQNSRGDRYLSVHA